MHRPDVEEMIVHLINEHGCDEARAMLEVTKRQAMIDAQQSGLTGFVPTLADGTPRPTVVNLTDIVSDLLFAQLEDFDALHDAHHGTRILATLTEERKANDVN